MYRGEKPQLSTPLVAFFLVALFLALATSVDMEEELKGLGYFCYGMALLFGLVFVITLANWIWAEINKRLYDSNSAINEPRIQLASAIKGLTTYQMDFVANLDHGIIDILGGEEGPLYRIPTGNGSYVPFEFVDLFLKKSYLLDVQDHAGNHYLFPIFQTKSDPEFREWRNPEKLATDFTNLLIGQQVVDRGSGPYSAKLKPGTPLAKIARKYGVDLSEVLIPEQREARTTAQATATEPDDEHDPEAVCECGHLERQHDMSDKCRVQGCWCVSYVERVGDAR